MRGREHDFTLWVFEGDSCRTVERIEPRVCEAEVSDHRELTRRGIRPDLQRLSSKGKGEQGWLLLFGGQVDPLH